MADDPESMVNWQRLGPDITTSGRLTEDDVARLGSLGVRHVINLALIDSPGALAGEDALMQSAGIGYTHIPVPFGAPEEAHYEAFCSALAGAPRPLHVHCIMNWRVSAFFYRWHRQHGGMDEAQARALMERQWRPEGNDQPDHRAWAQFVARGND